MARPGHAAPRQTDRPEREGLAARRAALAAVHRVVGGQGGVDDAPLPDEARDRAFARRLVSQTLRRLGQLRAALARHMDRPPHRGSRLEALMALGACQILFLDTPPHAAVDGTVRLAALSRDTARCRGLVNAVLRKIAAEREAILAHIEAVPNAPAWLLKRWAATYGEETAAAIAAAHLHEASLDLTVKEDAAGWAERLDGVVTATGSVRLGKAADLATLPGFADGAWWVQDAAAALPARLLGPVAGLRVADLCAAPGGKTAELAAAGASVTAVDRDPVRMARLRENLKRLRLEAETVECDVLDYAPSERFDAVLLDAPCTATGTIRRHPDIPWQRRPEDVPRLAELQAELLKRALALVKPGGLVVYATCSLEPEEGERQVDAALAAGAERVPIEPGEIGGLTACVSPEGDLRTLPCHDPGAPGGMDGFFATRLRLQR